MKPANIIHYEWRNKPEKCTIGGKTCEFKSQIERKWALYLQYLHDLGAIDGWEYEPKTFHFKERYGMKHQYTPDFIVAEDGEIIYHEVKTSLRQKDISRFRRLVMDFPETKMVLILPNDAKNMKQKLLKQQALKYIERIAYCNPLFKKFSIK